MTKWIGTLLFAVIALTSRPSAAEIKNGSEFLKICHTFVRAMDTSDSLSEANWLDAGYCFGFVDGVGQLANIIGNSPQKIAGMERLAFCPPAGITTDQAIRIVVKFMEDNPQELHKSALFLTGMSLSLAFPCN